MSLTEKNYAKNRSSQKKQRKSFSPCKTVYGEDPRAIFFMYFSKNLKVNSIIMRFKNLIFQYLSHIFYDLSVSQASNKIRIIFKHLLW